MSFGDLLTQLRAELDSTGRSALWRFAPEDAALIEAQLWVSLSDGLAPPMPNMPREHHIIATGRQWIGECEARGYTAIEWGQNGATPVVVFRSEQRPRWPRDLTNRDARSQYRAIANWLDGSPWTLPEEWRAAWQPLLVPLRQQVVLRFEQRRIRRTPREWPDQNLVELIGQMIELTKHGNQYWGRCPFHEDRTPSLSVHTEKGWYCHSCGTGGKAGSWIQALKTRPMA